MNTAFKSQVRAMAASMGFPEAVYVTRPNLPPLDDVMNTLKPAWDRRWITNDGELHIRLETELAKRLGVPYLNLFCNGTVALLTALKVLNLEEGAVITTPFTFPATVSVLYWCGLRPVYCDIQPDGYNLDPAGIEALIGPDTKAILPVHVYGIPCDVAAIKDIADRHGLPVIYDAAHAFGVRLRGESVLVHGDLSMLSFHATKVFTTAEGGALATGNPELHQRARVLKNFGITGEESVVAPGLNGKMNEMQAALGLAQLDGLDANTEKRRRLDGIYRRLLQHEPGLALLDMPRDVDPNYAYFPVRVQEALFGLNRDTLYETLKAFNIQCRKYFYPLCSSHPWCSAKTGTLPRAEAAADEVLCLPMYGQLPEAWAEKIGTIIKSLGSLARI
ncbi:MAG TPA: DegT/DnrJ/EryC1/StrS family aminotransferase [Candidatus Hydrogenedentes bacterium]|nr:MAG: dTDP-4-amino-4,6-dideoxy-D-glucose transaminase [Candidatus Hydrogenedentes bacterium ADurb.Bin101]HOC69501.1 DegT/DnrJ/EryC1/StrS family aminotransferase [Candidatus Hydrogenedentota bacterium]HQN00009.1 DegT/DnrJ/EryC1/StrS family aminotransferase [Candidatus Hydrogenedentota bacterium]